MRRNNNTFKGIEDYIKTGNTLTGTWPGSSGSPYPYEDRYGPQFYEGGISDEFLLKLETELWRRMAERPVIIACKWCDSRNAITNPTCIKCGGPLGEVKHDPV